ncbi:MAG: IgGFc-binding protein [Polyangiaceae bacterium]
MASVSRLTAVLCGLAGGAGAVLPSCGSDSDGENLVGTGGGAASDAGGDSTICGPGQFRCAGTVATPCDSTAGSPAVDCADEGKKCIDSLGCVTCVPGVGSCKNGVATWCRSDGSEATFECDPVQGMSCEADGCRGACSAAELESSYLGCDYYPTVTLNPVWSGFEFAVAVANAGSSKAKVTITKGGSSVQTSEVAPGALEIFKLPWVSELKGGDVDACQIPPDPGATRIVKAGAYRVRTDQPVTVYQLSPLTYQITPVPAACPIGKNCAPGAFGDDCLAFSNDASLLLPATALSGSYTSATWPAAPNRAGFLAVTATVDGTSVQVSGRGDFTAGAGLDAKGNGTVSLDRGDVLQILSKHDGPAGQFGADISGTRIQASAPVQVIAGHSCANVPEPTTDACDHVEHALLPAETLGKEYLVTFPAALASESPHVVKIVAVEDATSLQFDPAVHPPATLGPTDAPLLLEKLTQDFRITASKPVLVAQLMQGQASVPSGSGDPSLAVAVPTAQFRKDYLFIASSTYDTNFVNVVAPSGSAVTLDGSAIPASEFTAIGSTGYSVARHQLDGQEVHSIQSSAAFGIVVYGYGRFTSFMYPGGLDLERIAPPIVF